MANIEVISFDELAKRYCERQESTPVALLNTLRSQRETNKCDGWMLLECQIMDSSYLGSYTILAFGPNNTYKSVPDHPISVRGLASDTSVVKAICTSLDTANAPS